MMAVATLKEKVRHILHLGDSPQRTALAFAIGAFIAFSPTYGLHTASVFLCAWGFRLNFLAVMAGNLINNPWTFLPIIGSSMWIGLLIVPVGAPPDIDWNDFTSHMLWDQFQILWNQFHPYLIPFVLGHTLLGVVAAIAGYLLVYHAIVRFRQHHARTHGQAPVAPPPPSC